MDEKVYGGKGIRFKKQFEARRNWLTEETGRKKKKGGQWLAIRDRLQVAQKIMKKKVEAAKALVVGEGINKGRKNRDETKKWVPKGQIFSGGRAWEG